MARDALLRGRARVIAEMVTRKPVGLKRLGSRVGKGKARAKISTLAINDARPSSNVPKKTHWFETPRHPRRKRERVGEETPFGEEYGASVNKCSEENPLVRNDSPPAQIAGDGG